MDLENELDVLRRGADQSSELRIWRGKYSALDEECEALREANSTLRLQSRTTVEALNQAVRTRSPLASPRPPSPGGSISEVEAARLRNQVANLSRENRQLTRANEELSAAAPTMKRTRPSDPAGSAASAELEEMRKKWTSWSSEIVKGKDV